MNRFRRSLAPILTTSSLLASALLAACASTVSSDATRADDRAESTGNVENKLELGVVTNGVFQNVYVYPNPSQQNWEDHLKGLKAPALRSDNDQFSRKAIDAFTERLMSPGAPSYFDSLYHDYLITTPQFFGSAVISQACIDAAMKDANAAGGVMQGSTIRSLSNCHVDGMDPAPQLNLIFSPEMQIGSATVAGNTAELCSQTGSNGGHPLAWHGGGVNSPNFNALPTKLTCAGSFDRFTQSISHEIAEMLSDPGITMAPEVGDACENRPDAFMQWAGFSVSRYWSNAYSSCLPFVDGSLPVPANVASLVDASEAPLARLTGNLHDLNVPMPPMDGTQLLQSLSLVISTGNDDLRGGSNAGDNCDVTVQLSSGPVLLPNVNHGQTWAGWTKNTIAVPIPAGTKAGDIRSVKLHTGFGGGIGGDNWNVERVQLLATVPPATFANFSPNAGAREGGGSITITGTSFDTNGGTQILFGSTPATSVTCANSTQCTGTIPAGSGSTGVTVKVRGATVAVSNGQPFRWVPSILSVTPATGHAGDTITIAGIGLGTGMSVAFGAALATNVVCNNDSCTVTVPPGAGSVDVVATVSGHSTAVTSADAFSYGAPSITSIEHTHGGITGGEVLGIHGTGFDVCPNAGHGDETTSMQVYFGNTPARSVSCSSGQLLGVIIPPATAPGPVDIRVVSYGQTTATGPADVFTYTAYPALAGFITNDWPAGTPTAPYGSVMLATVTLDSVAPAGGALITITPADPTALLTPATVLIPAGSDVVSFPIKIGATFAFFGEMVTAAYQGGSVSGLVTPAPLVCGKVRACRKGMYWDEQECACMLPY